MKSRRETEEWVRIYDFATQLAVIAKHHLTEEEYIQAIGELVD